MQEDAGSKGENGQQRGRKRPRMQESGAPAHLGKEDRLSNLPDDILRSILSLLPVKYAVRATFLSRRWRHVLPTIDLLDLSPAALSGEDELDAGGWVSAAWQKIESARFPVRRCKITNPGGRPPAWEDNYFKRWVRALAHRDVRELAMADEIWGESWDAAVVFGKCRELRKLKVRNCHVRLSGHIPCTYGSCAGEQPPLRCSTVRCKELRELRLERTGICDHSLEAIVAECPRLEKLELICCTGACRTCRIAPAPQLRSLLLAAAGRTRAIVVDAPKLMTLKLQLRPQMERVEIRSPTLRELKLHLLDGWRPEIYLRMAPILGEVLRDAGEGLTSLTLRGISADCLSMNRDQERFVPRFRHLRKLFASIEFEFVRQSLFLATLLEKCECLQQLNITISRLRTTTLYLLDGIRGEKLKRSPCLHHLQKITISGFTASLDQLELAGFFLREAKVLKSLTLALDSKCSEADVAAARGLSSVAKRESSSQVRLVVKQAGRSRQRR